MTTAIKRYWGAAVEENDEHEGLTLGRFRTLTADMDGDVLLLACGARTKFLYHREHVLSLDEHGRFDLRAGSVVLFDPYDVHVPETELLDCQCSKCLPNEVQEKN